MEWCWDNLAPSNTHIINKVTEYFWFGLFSMHIRQPKAIFHNILIHFCHSGVSFFRPLGPPPTPVRDLSDRRRLEWTVRNVVAPRKVASRSQDVRGCGQLSDPLAHHLVVTLSDGLRKMSDLGCHGFIHYFFSGSLFSVGCKYFSSLWPTTVAPIL